VTTPDYNICWYLNKKKTLKKVNFWVMVSRLGIHCCPSGNPDKTPIIQEEYLNNKKMCTPLCWFPALGFSSPCI
jgi:hypothetical protein